MVEYVHLNLPELVSNCHEARKEPGISKHFSTIYATSSSLKSHLKGMEHTYINLFSYAGKTGKNSKHERVVDASN